MFKIDACWETRYLDAEMFKGILKYSAKVLKQAKVYYRAHIPLQALYIFNARAHTHTQLQGNAQGKPCTRTHELVCVRVCLALPCLLKMYTLNLRGKRVENTRH